MEREVLILISTVIKQEQMFWIKCIAVNHVLDQSLLGVQFPRGFPYQKPFPNRQSFAAGCVEGSYFDLRKNISTAVATAYKKTHCP